MRDLWQRLSRIRKQQLGVSIVLVRDSRKQNSHQLISPRRGREAAQDWMWDSSDRGLRGPLHPRVLRLSETQIGMRLFCCCSRHCCSPRSYYVCSCSWNLKGQRFSSPRWPQVKSRRENVCGRLAGSLGRGQPDNWVPGEGAGAGVTWWGRMQ